MTVPPGERERETLKIQGAKGSHCSALNTHLCSVCRESHELSHAEVIQLADFHYICAGADGCKCRNKHGGRMMSLLTLLTLLTLLARVGV